MEYSTSCEERNFALNETFCNALANYSNKGDSKLLAEMAYEINHSDEDLYIGLLLLKMLEKEYPDLQSKLGGCYYRGNGVKKDERRSLELFQLAAEKESIQSYYELGWYYYEHKEYLRATEYFELCIKNQSELSEHQIRNSYSCLGDSYTKTFEPKLDVAIECLAIAADKYHDPYASTRLGAIYGDKNTRYFDADKSLAYYTIGAQNGNEMAAHYLATTYLIGNEKFNIHKNGKIAEEILKPYEDKKNFEIQRDLGILYLEGDIEHGINPDFEKACKYYNRAWEIQPTGEVASDLGYVYFRLNRYSEAEEKLLYADQEGNSMYSDFLARIYLEGLSGNKDAAKAAFYYGKRYNLGNLNNAFLYCEYIELLEELGNYQRAYDVADNGEQEFNDIYFVFFKAKLLLNGNVHNGESLEKAADMMKICIQYESNVDEARIILGRYYLRNNEYRNAERYLLESYEGGNIEAAVELGHLYEFGGGTISADVNKAFNWYQKAAEAGNELGLQEIACFKKGLFGGYKRMRSV